MSLEMSDYEQDCQGTSAPVMLLEDKLGLSFLQLGNMIAAKTSSPFATSM